MPDDPNHHPKLTREHLHETVENGGSVFYGYRRITDPKDLPTEERLVQHRQEHAEAVRKADETRKKHHPSK